MDHARISRFSKIRDDWKCKEKVSERHARAMLNLNSPGIPNPCPRSLSSSRKGKIICNIHKNDVAFKVVLITTVHVLFIYSDSNGLVRPLFMPVLAMCNFAHVCFKLYHVLNYNGQEYRNTY